MLILVGQGYQWRWDLVTPEIGVKHSASKSTHLLVLQTNPCPLFISTFPFVSLLLLFMTLLLLEWIFCLIVDIKIRFVISVIIIATVLMNLRIVIKMCFIFLVALFGLMISTGNVDRRSPIDDMLDTIVSLILLLQLLLNLCILSFHEFIWLVVVIFCFPCSVLAIVFFISFFIPFNSIHHSIKGFITPGQLFPNGRIHKDTLKLVLVWFTEMTNKNILIPILGPFGKSDHTLESMVLDVLDS